MSISRGKAFEETSTFKRDWRGAKEKLLARYIKRTRRISWRTRFVPEYRAIFNRASFTPTDQPIFYVNTATRKSHSFSLSFPFFLSRLNLEFCLVSIRWKQSMTDSFPDPFCLQFLDDVSKPYFIDRFRDAMNRKGRLRVKLSDAI